MAQKVQQVKSPSHGSGDSTPGLGESVSKFSIDMYKLLCGGDGNMFMSPYSVSAALMLTMLGTKGESYNQLEQALSLSGRGFADVHAAYQNNHNHLTSKTDENTTLAIANRMFARQGLTIKQDYTSQSLKYYGSELEVMDFIGDAEGSRVRINTWVEEQTRQKIKDLLPSGSINANSLVVLTNAIYFKGSWDKKFKSEDTVKNDFKTVDGQSVPVDMMQATFKGMGYRRNDSLKCSTVELPYKNRALSMLIILPDDVNGLKTLEKDLSVDILNSLCTVYNRDVNLSIPKFKLESDFQLHKVLPQLGITDVFVPGKGNFSAMIENAPPDTHISDIIHKAFVEVNEEGTEAAAATAIMIRCMCMPPPPVEFVADHPFLFLIRENETGTILFIGRFMKPPQ